MKPFYITTPIYYVNDQPHIGHIYTTAMARILAAYHRLAGREVFFLTGVDEHAAKVADAAAERGLAPQEWADRNAAVFQQAFERFGLESDDFIRTSQLRHKERVQRYVTRLLETGAIYAGEYEGWYDAGQEEYLPENKAKETDYRSPISGKPLVRKKERNYFFALSRYEERLRHHIEENPDFVRPEARRNEVLGRLREGLNDVPISRTGAADWGIPMPGDPEQTIYVWIDALFNYRTAVDTPERLACWPPDVQLLAKEIVWFHAVVWPALLMALDWPLPQTVYAHSFWISEGQKMSKSMGNFVDLATLDRYVEEFGLDALRYYLATQGPFGAKDADFARAKFIEVYNSDLANDLGNTASRILAMTRKYFGGRVPAPHPEGADPLDAGLRTAAETAVRRFRESFDALELQAAVAAAWELQDAMNGYIVQVAPWEVARRPEGAPRLATALYHLLEALRLTALMAAPVVPAAASELHERLGLGPILAHGGPGLLEWGGIEVGAETRVGPPLFPRHEG